MKTKTNIQHDYLTLAVFDTAGTRLNLTWSRRGEKVSCKPGAVPSPLLNQILKSMDARKTGRLDQYLERISERCAGWDSFDHLPRILEEARDETLKVTEIQKAAVNLAKQLIAKDAQPKSISGRIREMIRAGKTDEEIFKTLDLGEKRRHYPAYYRREMAKA